MSENSRSKPSELYKEIGRNICRFRKELSLSQTELGAKAKMRQPLIAAIEIGIRRITLDALMRVVEALHVSVNDLLPAPKDPKKPGPRPQLAVACEDLSELPEKEQNAVIMMIDSLKKSQSK